MTRVIDTSGNVLIENLPYLPSPGEKIEKDGKQYVVTNDGPVTRQVDNGFGGKPFMRHITARPADADKPELPKKQQQSGRRGPAVEG